MNSWVCVVLVVVIREIFCEQNNVCSTFKDYKKMDNNSNCWYNFAADSSCPEIIKKSGYEVEQHDVTTEDGYVLTVFRIPNRGGRPIFMLHGVASSSSLFVGLGVDSLAFILADLGYDVWLGNFRGNEYSSKHVNLTVYDKKFWDYSTDEIALYDLPAIINLIDDETGNKGKIIYIGHSLGTTAALMYGSTFPDTAKKKIKIFILLGPAYKMPNMISPYRYATPSVLGVIRSLNGNRLLSQAEPMKTLTKLICLESPELMKACLNALNLFCGMKSQITPELAPVLFNQIPGGTALKVYFHIVQFVSNKFSKFDYGIRNVEVYGQPHPPKYYLSNINVPCYVIYSAGDWATTKQDALILYKTLPESVRFGKYEIPEKNFNHLDFFLSYKAKPLLYDRLVTIIKNVSGR